MSALFSLATRALRLLDAEDAHRATIAALKLLPSRMAPASDPRLRVSAFGLEFENPVGLAAGFDKDAEVPDAMLAFGFGFVEVGTLTPLAQPGNARPRAFRLVEDRAVINRYGFNNRGHAPALERLLARRARGGVGGGVAHGIVGVNVGANKDARDRVADYVAGVKTFAEIASYLTINVSSPNTPGLRDLQEKSALQDLLARVMEARAGAAAHPPLLLKIAPDVTLAQLDDIVRVTRDARIDGMIVSNTTLSRPPALRSPQARESGGLSGAPLFDLSTRRLAQTFLRVERQFPLIGAGGVDSAEKALAKMEAGATLLQLYSALVYEGPGLAARVCAGLSERLTREQNSLAGVVGAGAEKWAAE